MACLKYAYASMCVYYVESAGNSAEMLAVKMY